MTAILLVDDSATVRQILANTLKPKGYNIVGAIDGYDALTKAQKQNFDLIITDLNMPNKNGLEMVTALRKMEKYENTPIIMITTESDASKKKKGKHAGVNVWIVKPFKPDKFIDTIKELLEKTTKTASTKKEDTPDTNQ